MKTQTSRLLLATTLTAVAATVLIGCNKAPETTTTTTAPSSSVGTQVDDTGITARVKSALLADSDVKGFDVSVETRNGRVQLSGDVDNQTQIDRALTVARGVSGVTDVENSMKVKDTMSSTMGTTMDDASVTGRVKTALLAESDIRSFDISVDTVGGEVKLTGVVDNQSQIDRAAQIARAAEGASSVKNELTIKR